MTNKHIKVINGRKYYYESIRIGKKVTSRYIGPVERIRKRKAFKVEPEQVVQITTEAARQTAEEQVNEERISDDENYIG
jgi:hypothetical protein